LTDIPVEIGPNQAMIDGMVRGMDETEKRFCSKTFCSAKWKTLHINLQNGYQSSCHHPTQKKIKIESLVNNPSGLHNTPEKKEYRKMMLNGERPAECDYCWNIEDLSEDHMSDRTYKTMDPNWSLPYLDEIEKTGWERDINPSYLEVSFSNVCNFKCIYCSPDISSQWMDEIRKHGPYPTSTKTHDLDYIKKVGKFPIHHKEHNPYVEAFWEWWPELYPSLDTFRITGGEPLLSKETWRILDYINKNPRKDLNLAINTNMGIPDDVLERFISIYNEIKGKIKTFEIFTSCEAAGKSAEYIRFGMNYPKFMENIKKFLRETGTESRVHFMVTFNVLSMESFISFLADIWRLRVEFNETDAMNRIPMMIAYLRWPNFLSMQIAPEELKEKFSREVLAYVEEYAEPEPSKKLIINGKTISPKTGRFYLEEIDQVKRLCEFMSQPPPNPKQQKEDFWNYIEEYDQRRNRDFGETFPQLADFFCEELMNE